MTLPGICADWVGISGRCESELQRRKELWQEKSIKSAGAGYVDSIAILSKQGFNSTGTAQIRVKDIGNDAVDVFKDISPVYKILVEGR